MREESQTLRRSRKGVAVEHQGAKPQAPVEEALGRWRRKASEVLMAVVALAHLPGAVLAVLGYAPAMPAPLLTAGLTAYGVMAAAAVLWRMDHELRLRLFFTGAFAAIVVLNLGRPQGPYAQVGLATLPVLVSVVAGIRAGRMAVPACLAILVAAPVLRSQPAVIRALDLGRLPQLPLQELAVQGVAQASFMIGLLVLLDVYQRFLMETLAAQRRTSAELAAAQREIAEVGDEERRRLGQELHDGVCQQLTAALWRGEELARRAEDGAALRGEDFRLMTSLLSESIEETRNVSLGLWPLDEEPGALERALTLLARRVGDAARVRCEFSTSGDVRLEDPDAAQHLYRVAQEALSNAVRHAGARLITLELKGSGEELALRVEDDGRGMPDGAEGEGMGLRTMTYRAQLLGGELSVERAAGGGTCITCRAPRPRVEGTS